MSPFGIVLEAVDPRGRCNRRGLLLIAIALLAVQLVLAVLLWQGVLLQGGPVMRIAEVLLVAMAISATSKRLHDIGLSAWWILAGFGGLAIWSVLLAVVLVFTIGAAALQPGTMGFAVAVVGTMTPAFLATLWLHVAKSEVGANRFGAEPSTLGFAARDMPAAGARFGSPAHGMRA